MSRSSKAPPSRRTADSGEHPREFSSRVTAHRLQSSGVEVLLRTRPDGLPEVLHWGAPLGPIEPQSVVLGVARQVSPSALDEAWSIPLVPGEHDGWEGRPALVAHRSGRAVLPRWNTVGIDHRGQVLHVRAEDARAEIRLDVRFNLDGAGVLRVSTTLENIGLDALSLSALEAVMPVGDSASEVLDFSGRWTRERAPQRAPLTAGSRIRESRRGRTGHDSPLLLVLAEEDAAPARHTGQVWAVHLAWSGDAIHRVDALPEASTIIGAGPLLRPGEVELAAGGRFTTPPAVFAWSDEGLDGLSARLHQSIRARPSHPASPRPVTLNTWEAVYFDHDLARLEELARLAAQIGVERFVLDDGWFRARRSDRAGLGDWQVDPDVWPCGLGPLADIAHGLGMQFGLWFEPEMVNLDSDLARSHPDWLLQPIENEVRTWRHQYVLDLARPAVFGYLLESISDIVTAHGVDYIKWDQNRDVTEAVRDGRPGLLEHTRAVYALMDELRDRHPGLEIESCASGGARVDLGILERTDRVWASDTNDPIERLDIQRWTEVLLPLELIGSHVGPEVSHTTHRVTTLAFRIAASLFASFGIEWDITTCTPDELAELTRAISAYRRLRPLLHSGRVRHGDADDAGIRMTTVTADDRSSALVRLARVATAQRALPPLVRVPALEPEATYRVVPVPELRQPTGLDLAPPPWMSAGELRLTGAALAHVGLRIPLLAPGEALVLEIERLNHAPEP